MSQYTASGARRTGDEYQDLLSVEVLIEWLEQPERYRWVRLETMDGSLDDIQAEYADGRRRLLQVKFGTDITRKWTWEELTKQDIGKRGPKSSLLQKWKESLDDVTSSGVEIHDAALLTNRSASTAIQTHLSDFGTIDYYALPSSLQDLISEQLGGQDAANTFFSSFRFNFAERSLESLSEALWVRFRRLGGTSEGWSSLMSKTRHWINRQDEPTPEGNIFLADIREAALWHLPPQIPQNFLVPDDYVAPSTWSNQEIEPRLRAGGDGVVVLTGHPGVGKSTYLSWLVDHLRDSGTPAIRHHYFLSTTDGTSARTDWVTASNALIGQLLSLYPELVRTIDSRNPLPETLRTFLTAAGDERAGKDPLVVIVDGLDHVWRETGSEDGVRRLFDLILPAPEGIVVVVGTQHIDIARIPRKLRELCPRNHWLQVPKLGREGVYEWLQHHGHELELSGSDDIVERELGNLATVFTEVTSGYPLLLHYTLNKVLQGSPLIGLEQVRDLLAIDSGSTVAEYYRILWEEINPEGHQLLHLLAGYPWGWPPKGLIQCLASTADTVRLEQGERAVRHVLGTSREGVTAFHESLLAFVRAQPDHEDVVQTLRPSVLGWLTQNAPEYWQWRYEWEERAKNGDADPLISSPTLDWCVDSLVAGRCSKQIAEVVAASGWAALKSRRLGVATTRHYIEEYLDEARHSAEVLSKILRLALLRRDWRSRKLELQLFLSRVKQKTDAEIEVASEVAFLTGLADVCAELREECVERWNAAIKRDELSGDTYTSLSSTLPSVLAASLSHISNGPYRSYVSEHGHEPEWCTSRRYAQALARHCILADDTKAVRDELRFLANDEGRISYVAVDEIVRIAWRDGFDPGPWIKNSEARRSGLFRCDQLWIRQSTINIEGVASKFSFRSISQKHVWQGREDEFVELARSYFFSCLAAAAENQDPPRPDGLNPEATRVAAFLSLLCDLALEAANAKKNGEAIAGAWLIARLLDFDPPKVEPYDFENDLAEPRPVARVVIAIAQDLENLHLAEIGSSSISSHVIETAIKSSWTWAQIWIEERVERRLPMSDASAAYMLIDREEARLQEDRDNLHSRAKDYADLALFSHVHELTEEKVLSLATLSARNLLGHGYHKDMVLFDLLAGIQTVSNSTDPNTLKHLRTISPVIQIVDDITDGDETNYLKSRLAEVVHELCPEVLPSYLRALQHNQEHWQVELCFSDLAMSTSLETDYHKALASTLVHEQALVKLQRRADTGDTEAALVLSNIQEYLGRTSIAVEEANDPSTKFIDEDNSAISVEKYPPERLSDFVQAKQEAGIYGDEISANWTAYWQSEAPEKLLAVLTDYRDRHGRPLEQITAKAITELALELSGRGAAWDWLVSYHTNYLSWSRFYRLSDAEWIWEFVKSRFSDRWLEFVAETSRPRWRALGGAPVWGIARMVRFLQFFEEYDLADEVLDAAVRWGSGLAANMRLPEHALDPDPNGLPIALNLLVDRLDCPSRMVQERAAWALAGLLADANTYDLASSALLGWHAASSLELRSCTVLLILLLAKQVHDGPIESLLDIAQRAQLVPSIGADIMLREPAGESVPSSFTMPSYEEQHSGQPPSDFESPKGFEIVVNAHLAPVFNSWAGMLDRAGVPFSRQWEWEATQLAYKEALSLAPNAESNHHYTRSGRDGQILPINDRLSTVLRSAYLRALHWSIASASLAKDLAEMHAQLVAVMSDTAVWAVQPSARPYWWPVDPDYVEGLDTLGDAVGQAIRGFLDKQDNDDEVLLFAAGPVGSRSHLRAEVVIEGFLQASHGPDTPTATTLTDLQSTASCYPVHPHISVQGTYRTTGDKLSYVGDWLMAPLACSYEAGTRNWLLPERQARGLYVPVSWILPGEPVIHSNSEQIEVTVGNQKVARYRFWHDELRERFYWGAGSRVGAELLMRREWLTPHLDDGATLCWLITLSVTQRGEYEDQFAEPQIVGTWVVGGSSLINPKLWNPQAGAS